MVTGMTSNLYTLAMLALADWIIATTISRARVFRPLRAWVLLRSDYFGEGIACQYCISHWIGFALALWYQPRFLSSGADWVDVLLSAFIVIGAGALIARTVGKTPANSIHPDTKAYLEELREYKDENNLSRGADRYGQATDDPVETMGRTVAG